MHTFSPSRSGVIFNPSMKVLGTTSIQAVPQMPETRLYQMDLGWITCFPRCCQCVSVGSQTRTPSSLSRVGSLSSCSASVISKQKGRHPPWCSPTSFPLTNTSVDQSTASKCSSTRFPRHPSGILNVRRYHRISCRFQGSLDSR